MWIYCDRLLAEKRTELGNEISKLRNGLLKIDDTSEKVQVMSQELEVAKTKVAKISKECEEYLVVIVGQKREADEVAKVWKWNLITFNFHEMMSELSLWLI